MKKREQVVVRRVDASDSPDAIAALLNRAYASLAERGLRFVATWITGDMVRDSLSYATCLLAEVDGMPVGTVTLFEPDQESECELYRKPRVFHFGRFGVEPNCKGQGIGRRLFEAVQELARERGAEVLACDTAEPATDLIEMYRRWGFEAVASQDWSMTNYSSVVLAKRMS